MEQKRNSGFQIIICNKSGLIFVQEEKLKEAEEHRRLFADIVCILKANM
jgi:hypothetical protein